MIVGVFSTVSVTEGSGDRSSTHWAHNVSTKVEIRVRLLPFHQSMFATITALYQVLDPIEGLFINYGFMLAVNNLFGFFS